MVDKMTVKLKATLEIAHADSAQVEVSLWYGSVLDLSSDLIKELYDFQHLWKDFVKFTPRIVTFACPTCPKEIKIKSCYSDGQYCLLPQKQSAVDKFGANVTDEMLLLETLQARCVFETYRDSD